jgi:CheY-like chemotaxis protein
MSRERKRKILVVDDEPDNASIFTTGLEDGGFEVEKFTDSPLALSMFKAGNKYDLLILDIKMPDMNGFDLYEELRKIDNKVKICFFSASEHLTSNHKNLFQNSPDKFLFISKPISIPEMIRQIKQFLSR